MEPKDVNFQLDDIHFDRCYDGSLWLISCKCGKQEVTHASALFALKELGMHIACSRCRIEKPFQEATHIQLPRVHSSPEMFDWSEGETSE